MSVCVSIREHISGTTELIGTRFVCRSPVAVAPSSSAGVALCTSSLMDDVTFGRNGRDAERWRLHGAATAMSGVAIPGRNLMSINALFGSWEVVCQSYWSRDALSTSV